LTGAGLRKGLIVFQFVLSVVFVVGSMVVFQQLEYMRKKDLGFDRDNVFFFTYRESFGENYEEFKHEVSAQPSIRHIVRSSSNPMQVFGGMVLADDGWPGKSTEDDLVFSMLVADAELLEVMGFSFVQGRSFSGTPADSAAYILNEAAVAAMKLDNPIGTIIKAPTEGTVIGVVKNFHSNSMRDKLRPVIIGTRFEDFGVVLVKYEPGHTSEALLAVDAAYKKFNPDFPIEVKFMDDIFANQYSNEILMGKLATLCTSVALFISCMGLFGLISFSAERRRKEIGIRKVLGAHLYDVVSLLCRDTLILLVIALAIGIPIAGWAAFEFLRSFAFHADINVWMGVAVVLAMLSLALITISFQAIRAGRVNPADTLRSE
jgi:putative ABC transport system permease protein